MVLPDPVCGLRRRALQPDQWPEIPADADVSGPEHVTGPGKRNRVQHPVQASYGSPKAGVYLTRRAGELGIPQSLPSMPSGRLRACRT
jgi:hypothetical protein